MPTHGEMTATIEAYVAALSNGKLDEMLALCAPDVRIEDPVGTPERRGHAAIDALLRQAVDAGMLLVLTAPVCTTGHFAAFAFSATLGGGVMEIDSINIVEFGEDGKIVHMRAYWGPDNMRSTTG